jgi:hypothetical protein
MIKLKDILNEITISLNNFYPYSLSKGKNEYIAEFTTENQTEYRYIGSLKWREQILGISFGVINKPNVKDDIEKTSKNLKEVWLRILFNPKDSKAFFDLETKKGILNVNDINWDNLNVNIKNGKIFIQYIKSNFSSFNNISIDLNKSTSYNIDVLFLDLKTEKVNGTKITSGNQELILSINPDFKLLEFYYKLDLSELDKKLLKVIKPYIESYAESKHIGTLVTTNENNIFKVMNTIFKISKEIFDSNNKIKYISFKPALTSKENDLYQSKRFKLYKLYLDKFYPGSTLVTDEELEKMPYINDTMVYKIKT